ncbi:MAG: signal transduction histidine kinase [Lysobacterales bacterium]|jgi:signal transduction histidine kinase
MDNIYYVLSSLLNGLSSLTITIFILTYGKKSKLNKIFSLFTICISAWSLSYFFWQISNTYTTALFWTRVLTCFGFYIPTILFHVIVLIIKKESILNKFVVSCYSFSLLLTFLGFTPYIVRDVESILSFPYWPKPGLIYHFYVLYFCLLIPISLTLLRQYYIHLKGPQRTSLILFFWGSVLGFTGGAFNFPLWYNIPIAPIPNIMVTFYVIFIAYAILKYQFIDVRFVISKSILYTLLISLLSLLYFCFIYITEKYFESFFGYKSLFISIFLGSTIALVFIPLRNLLQQVIDKLLYKNNITKIAAKVELLEKEVAEQQKFKAVATLASGMAHEIKNPLTAINTFCEYLPQRKDDKEFLDTFAHIVGDEVKRINRIISQLLDFSKPTLINPQKENIHALIDDTLDFLNSKLLSKRITIKKNYTQNTDILITIDKNQIRQCLLNLFLNSIDAIASDGTISITTEKHHDENIFKFKINDTGSGISQEDLKHIFDPFYTKKDQGTGLGLSITRSILKEHHGSISISSAVNVGTEFVIKLPIDGV